MPEQPMGRSPGSPNREVTVNLAPEILEEWLQDHRTREVLRALKAVLADYQEQLLQGQTWRPHSAEETALLTSRLLGQIYALNLIVDLRPPDIAAEEPRKTGYEPTV